MINVTRSSLPPIEEYIDEIKELWDSHWLTNMGDKHKELQAKLEEFYENLHYFPKCCTVYKRSSCP